MSERSILIIEDDATVRGLVRHTLERVGYGVREAATGAEARVALAGGPVDLVVLDLMLPDADGLDLLAEIRDRDTLPVIVITSRASEGDRVLGLESGADDYVVKPFSARELAARVEAVLRRAVPSANGVMNFGSLVIQGDSRQVTVDGVAIELTRLEFDLLRHLAERPRTVCSRDDLLRDVWSSMPEYQDPSTVTEHVRRLRNKLGTAADLVTTIHGVGYRFDPESE